MARVFQTDVPLGVDFRRYCLHLIGERSLRKNNVELHRGAVAFDDRVGKAARLGRKLCEDPFNLRFFLRLENAHLVVRFNNADRLDEYRCAARRGVVNEALNLRPVFRLYGNDKASASLGDDRLLQIFLIESRMDHFFELFARLYLGAADLPAQIKQRRRSLIGDLFFR